MAKESIIFREAAEGDKERILNLFRAAFIDSEIKEKDRDLWTWQMERNPDGKPFLALAEINGEIVGHYAIIPYNYYTETHEIIKVGLVVDVMVHPKHQHQGIFVNLSRYALPLAIKKMNLKFTIGYPFTGTTYDAVIPGHTKVGWELRDRMNLYVFPIKPAKLVAFKFPRLKFASKIGGVFLSLFLPILEKLKSRDVKSQLEPKQLSCQAFEDLSLNETDKNLIEDYSKNKFIKCRNPEFLFWRYPEKPNSNYRYVKIIDANKQTKGIGFVAICQLQSLNLGIIMDMITLDKDLIYDLFLGCVELLKKEGCDAIGFLDYKESEFSMIRNKIGFIGTREYYQIINYKEKNEPFAFPTKPRVNFVDFDIF